MDKLYVKQAEDYANSRPTYPAHWYTMLADRTSRHSPAWDVGTGSGQAVIGVADHFEQVIATEVTEAQLNFSKPHPRVRYVYTPLSLSDDDLINLIGGENSVDLVTVATAVHWFDIPKFYSIVNRVLRKPGGIVAVWGYKNITVTPEIDAVVQNFWDGTIPYWNEKVKYALDGYQTIPFPFESVGLGSEGNPLKLNMTMKQSFDGFFGLLKSLHPVVIAKEKGVDLLSESFVDKLKNVWGESKLVRFRFGSVRFHACREISSII